MVKIAFFMATQKGYSTLKYLIDNHLEDCIGVVVTFKEPNVVISYHEKIRDYCCKFNIPNFLWKDVNSSLDKLINKYNIDSVVAISWRFMIPLEINRHLKYDLIVFHDSLLPKYRGFAPTPTAIICGEKKIGVTAIYATNEVDSGDIIAQKSVSISDNEYIYDIIVKQSQLYCQIMHIIIDFMNTGNIPCYAQDSNEATYSIWRSPDDCRIDWSLSSKEIYNFIRALGEPYIGAFTYVEGKKVVICKSTIVQDLKFVIRDYGKIWRIVDNKPYVICGNGMLRIDLAKYDDNEQVEFNKIRVRFN